MTYFEANEKLKEELVLNYKATQAITTFFNEGSFFVPEPFYETIITWGNDVDALTMKEAIKDIYKYKEEIIKTADMSQVLLEFNEGLPCLIWNIFPVND